MRKPSNPDCTRTIGVQLFGDEGEVFKGNSMMLLHWSSENSPYHSDPKLSRWLICILPVHMYAFREEGKAKVNLSLQAILKHVVESMQIWRNAPIRGLGMAFSSLKGDWKFLCQALNLARTPGSNECCLHCMCTKDLSAPYTDLGQMALWRTMVPTEPWHTKPELAKMQGFNLSLVGFDILHLFFLGTGRDLVSSVLIILLRLRIFDGRTVRSPHVFFPGCACLKKLVSEVEARMRDASKRIVAFSKGTDYRLPSFWVLSRAKLALKTGKFCHFHGKDGIVSLSSSSLCTSWMIRGVSG